MNIRIRQWLDRFSHFKRLVNTYLNIAYNFADCAWSSLVHGETKTIFEIKRKISLLAFKYLRAGSFLFPLINSSVQSVQQTAYTVIHISCKFIMYLSTTCYETYYFNLMYILINGLTLSRFWNMSKVFNFLTVAAPFILVKKVFTLTSQSWELSDNRIMQTLGWHRNLRG